MKITANKAVSHFNLEQMKVPRKEFDVWMQRDLIGEIGKVILQHPKFFSQKEDEESRHTIYEAQCVILSKETFEEMMQILTLHSNMSQYYIFQLKYILNEKP